MVKTRKFRKDERWSHWVNNHCEESWFLSAWQSPGSNTRKFSEQRHSVVSTKFQITLPSQTVQLKPSSAPLLLREKRLIALPCTVPHPLRKHKLLFHIRRKKQSSHPLISKCNPHCPIRTFFLENSTSVVFQHSVFDLPKRSPIQSFFSRVQNPNLFLWLLGDLPGGRQPSQRNRPLRMLPTAQEDSPNDWKWDSDLCPSRGQHALLGLRESRENLRHVALGSIFKMH